MQPDDLRISDPQRIRALSHPLRLELLDVLRDGPATATACAAATGESVASCSFHLRMLAKYGFITPGEQRGREKPWRLTSPGRDVRPDDDDPDSFRAMETMAQVALEHEVEHVRNWLAQMSTEPHEWVQASTIATSGFWATAEELREFSAQVQHLADRFDGRNTDPSSRPPGARPVRFLGIVHADLARESRAERSGG